MLCDWPERSKGSSSRSWAREVAQLSVEGGLKLRILGDGDDVDRLEVARRQRVRFDALDPVVELGQFR